MPLNNTHPNPTFPEALSTKRRVEKASPLNNTHPNPTLPEALQKTIASQATIRIKHSLKHSKKNRAPKKHRFPDNHQNQTFSEALEKNSASKVGLGLQSEINSDTIILSGVARLYSRLFIQRKKTDRTT